MVRANGSDCRGNETTWGRQMKTNKPIDMNDYGRLSCPCCKDEESNLHHGRIEVFNRQEDSETGNHTVIDGSKTIIDNDVSGNPSPRRDGISIVFWCEQCGEQSILDIIQHKGMSYMRWYDGRGFNE